MSVYTQLDAQDFAGLLCQYSLGELQSFEGIAAGIENTNYKITVKYAGTEQQYFLTIFEQIEKSELDFFIPLLAHLKSAGCQLPAPLARIDGQYLFTIQGKQGAIFECLEGYHPQPIKQENCQALGAQLAQIHLAAQDFDQVHENQRGFYWLQKQIQGQLLNVTADEQALLEEQLQRVQQDWQRWHGNADLPKGFIHGDLFDDNCLFKSDDAISGVIDFYAGGMDYWIYDLAICIMAWCKQDGQINQKFMQTLIDGYASVRPLSDSEKTELPNFLRLAILRFWASRLIAKVQQQGAALTTSKDPDEMKNLLLSLKS